MGSVYQKSKNVLNDLKVAYESKGYRFYIEPSASFLPVYLKNYRPDALALSDEENVIFEVVKHGKSGEEKAQNIKSLFNNLPENWRVEIVIIPEGKEDVKLATKEQLEWSRLNIDLLFQDGFYEQCMVSSFAAIEAVGRKLLNKRIINFDRNLSGSTMISLLEEEGYLSLKQAAFCRGMWKKRNSFVHGYYDDGRISNEECEKLMSIVVVLFNEVGIQLIS